eukprot:COSAG04_NODE_4736_length_1918_cov_2.150632_1_plen_495_part_01
MIKNLGEYEQLTGSAPRGVGRDDAAPQPEPEPSESSAAPSAALRPVNRAIDAELGQHGATQPEPEPELEPKLPLEPAESDEPRTESDSEDEETEGEDEEPTPWTQIILALLFIGTMFGFMELHFDIPVQHDVHSSLRADLRLHIDPQEGNGDFDSVSSAEGMFDWLQNELLPAVSNENPSLGAELRSTAQCRAALGDTASAEDSAGCDTCDNATGEQHDELTFINEYALLYQGILIRQTPHCQLATIDSSGELHREQLFSDDVECKTNSEFVETDQDITYFPGTGSESVLPGRGCYDFDLASLAASRNDSEAMWIRRARVTKEHIFIPTATGHHAAIAAGQAVLQAASDARWADPSTAQVEISFLIMSVQYGMLTEVSLTCDYHLGGVRRSKTPAPLCFASSFLTMSLAQHVETDFSMRSMSAGMLNTWRGWYRWQRWEPWGDTVFVLILAVRLVLELRVIILAATYRNRVILKGIKRSRWAWLSEMDGHDEARE